MRSLRALACAAAALSAVAACSAQAADGKRPRVTFETNLGSFEVTLFPDKAPVTVKNFLDYAESGFWEGLIFHRVIPGFMLQLGGFTPDLKQKQPKATIVNEATNGLKNLRGTLAMARTSDPNSASSQFFINTVDNAYLDHKSNDPAGMGYCVFGEITAGMDVVTKIENVRTRCPSKGGGPCNDSLPPGMRDVPADPVIIKKVTVKK